MSDSQINGTLVDDRFESLYDFAIAVLLGKKNWVEIEAFSRAELD